MIYKKNGEWTVNLLDRLRSRFLTFAGYLIPLVQSLPPLGVWTGLMTLPFATYLIMMFTNLPLSLPTALSEFFTPFLIIEKAFLIIGLIILVYSIAHLRMKKKEGLVASGPYRLVWHPQYFGIILATIGLTSWSVWILNNTFGMGFLTPSQTMGVWFIELLVYIFLARIEELFLSKKHGETYENYANQVPFFIPFLNTKRKFLDIPLSIFVPVLLLLILIITQTV